MRKRLYIAMTVCFIAVASVVVTWLTVGWDASNPPTGGSTPALFPSDEHVSAEDASRRMRLAHLQNLRHDAGDEELLRLMNTSDRATTWMDEHDIDSMQEYVHDRMREIDIPEEDIEEYYNANRELFGNRSLEESAYTIEKILKFQSVKQEFQVL
jgi:hypothetical protein